MKSGLYIFIGGAVFIIAYLLIAAFTGEAAGIDKRLTRVTQRGQGIKINIRDRVAPNSVRSTKDSTIPLLNQLVKILPNPNKLRARLASTGRTINLGEYLLINALAIFLFYLVFNLLGWSKMLALLVATILGLSLPHFVTGSMVKRRLKKFLAYFPEAIDTMCRGIRSGLPITESIGAVGREMPNPIGIEFHRISDGVRMGKSLEASMWEVAQRIDTPEFRFLIIAMAIQKETGGNLAETLGNLADLIRKRRQLRLKIKAMSSEAMASAMIIGSLPFVMFLLLLAVNSEYMMVMFHRFGGRVLLGVGITWMLTGWAVMVKMTQFEI